MSAERTIGYGIARRRLPDGDRLGAGGMCLAGMRDCEYSQAAQEASGVPHFSSRLSPSLLLVTIG